MNYCRYEVNPDYVEKLESHGMKFTGRDTENVRMEIMELNGPGNCYRGIIILENTSSFLKTFFGKLVEVPPAEMY